MAPNRPWRFGQRRAIRVAKESNNLLDRERRQEPSKGNRLRNSALGGVVGRDIILTGLGVDALWFSGDQACMAPLLGDRPMHRMLLVAAAFAFGAAVIQSGDAYAQAGKNKAPPRSSGGAAGGIVSEGQGYGVFISTQRT